MNQYSSMELDAYVIFCSLFESGQFGGQRFGQAFYNHFNLHKMNNRSQFDKLYEADGHRAKSIIHQHFNFV